MRLDLQTRNCELNLSKFATILDEVRRRFFDSLIDNNIDTNAKYPNFKQTFHKCEPLSLRVIANWVWQEVYFSIEYHEKHGRNYSRK